MTLSPKRIKEWVGNAGSSAVMAALIKFSSYGIKSREFLAELSVAVEEKLWMEDHQLPSGHKACEINCKFVKPKPRRNSAPAAATAP